MIYLIVTNDNQPEDTYGNIRFDFAWHRHRTLDDLQ